MDNLTEQLKWIEEKLMYYDTEKVHTFKRYELLAMKEEIIRQPPKIAQKQFATLLV
jgi:hypothetical protein